MLLIFISCLISSFWSQEILKGVLISCEYEEKSMSKKSILGFPNITPPHLILLFNDKNTEVKVLQSNRTNRIETDV